jgi:hypothetical protein
VGLALGVHCAGCSSGTPAATPADDAGAPTVFVSQLPDFDGFCNWASAPASAPGDASDGVHGLGPLRVYWNKPPPHGATEFPVGTIVVKESEQADAGARVVFAMVKRAAPSAYNAAGGGWEWWSLQDDGCSMSRLWRGPFPPATESYAGSPVGDCNGCHSQADNDFVWDTALQLSKF